MQSSIYLNSAKYGDSKLKISNHELQCAVSKPMIGFLKICLKVRMVALRKNSKIEKLNINKTSSATDITKMNHRLRDNLIEKISAKGD